MTLVDFSPKFAVNFCYIAYILQAGISHMSNQRSPIVLLNLLCLVSFIIGICASEGILVARTAAVWGNGKRVFWVLVTLLGLGAAIVISLAAKYGSIASMSKSSGSL